MGITVMSTKGQVVLPKAVREALNLKPGARLVVETRNGGVFLREESAGPVPARTIEEVLALARDLRKHGVQRTMPITPEEMEEAVMEAVAEDWERFEQSCRDLD
jgi:AbrB family looped-hinge helix DNA binding protein